tara:strand:+ start:17392 stop:17628 length:237 start_codon:yes stop_codon:yes gene_type:complete
MVGLGKIDINVVCVNKHPKNINTLTIGKTYNAVHCGIRGAFHYYTILMDDMGSRTNHSITKFTPLQEYREQVIEEVWN